MYFSESHDFIRDLEARTKNMFHSVNQALGALLLQNSWPIQTIVIVSDTFVGQILMTCGPLKEVLGEALWCCV
jgi:hypothetical protein